MRITFQTQEAEKQQENIKNIYQDKHGQQIRTGRNAQREGGYAVTFAGGSEAPWVQGKKQKSFAQLQQEAGNIDVGIRQDYMTLMSNTMSEEDYAKLQEEGFDFSSMSPEEAVTIVDKIKAELARSGQHIAGYTDDLDMETLSAALGSDTLARAVSDSFREADIPLTQENIDGVKRAWDMASQLETPGAGACHYMVGNQSEPEICEFYFAQSSGAESVTKGTAAYYAEDVRGYYTQSAGAGKGQVDQPEEAQALQKQIDKIISEANLELTEENRQNAHWLLEQGLPVTKENLQQLNRIQSVTFPVEEHVFAEAVAGAIAEGKAAVSGNLADTENIYEKAARQSENFLKQAEKLFNQGDVTARRQLEEIRLRMTAEVNVKLIKSGFSIDTAPMEELLEALKRVEAELAESYFPGDAGADEKYALYRQTNQITEELPGLPADIVGSWSRHREPAQSTEDGQDTLAAFHGEGKALREAYDKAQESYEALMTAPRRDLGDSIHKAFANVDAILEDLGLPLTEENQRAARILGYNRMELTVENMERIKQTDKQVCSVISRMTPAATLQMIRDGVNPLEMSFEELENYFAAGSEEYEESAESYSRFLYHLEQNKQITAAEREAYIGIYRLVRQIEKSDGAAIGAVVNTGAELQFSNLLSAIRSSKFHHMDVKVTDETGLMQELVQSENNISRQIQEGIAAAREMMTEVSSDKETEEQYRMAKLEELRQIAKSSPENVTFLKENQLPLNGDNLLAARELIQKGSNPFRKCREKAEELERKLLESEAPEEFREEYRSGLSEMIETVEHVTMEEAKSSLDVKELRLTHKQLTIMTKLSDTQEYILPMYIGEELGRVHLTLVRGAEEKGTVTMQMDWAENCHGEAHIQVDGSTLTGYLVGSTKEEVTKLQKAADIFHEMLKEDTSMKWEQGVLPVVSRTTDVSDTTFIRREQKEDSDTTALYQIARKFLQAMKR